MDINKTLAKEFGLRQEQVDNTIALIDDDKTIPFIARYRKELTGSLDDQILRELYDRLMYLRNLEKRKEEVTAAITEQEKMTPEIEAAISAAVTLVEVEDIYRPFKPKRRTRASIARENGLEPLAVMIMAQENSTDPEKEAEAYIDEEKKIPDAQTALQGAMDIIAEDISDDADIRKKLRALAGEKGELVSKAADSEAESVYMNYYEYSEAIPKVANHRVLAPEYRDVVPRGYVRVFAALTALMDAGVKVRFFTGNHDIWAYSYFESLGMERMEQPALVEIAGKTFCLGHGDGLGPGMRGYKVMRWIFHNRFLQRAFSTLHPWLAFRLGNGWSRQSRLAKDKPYDFRGEAEPLYQWCADFEARQHVDWFIFGHYHTKVDLTLPGGGRLMLLQDWMEKSPYFLFDGLSVLTFLT